MRRREKPVDHLDEEPPSEIVRFIPSQPAPIGEHGRPEPWRVRWEPDEFAAFLRARAAWRDTHEKPLYGLYAQERMALHNLASRLPRALVAAEESGWPRSPIPPCRPARTESPAPSSANSEDTTP